jgi:hypothetical protein
MPRGPSTIGVDTIFRSKGAIPEGFLRGTGVPESFVAYARSQADHPIEFYSCFLSFPVKIRSSLNGCMLIYRVKACGAGLRQDPKTGDHFQERIEESIRLYDKVMIILSEYSVQRRWVEPEVNAAREREDREKRTVLFPVRIDEAVMNAAQPWATDLRRSRHIGDFRAWQQHSSYRKAFDRPLRDLKASEKPRPAEA